MLELIIVPLGECCSVCIIHLKGYIDLKLLVLLREVLPAALIIAIQIIVRPLHGVLWLVVSIRGVLEVAVTADVLDVIVTNLAEERRLLQSRRLVRPTDLV